MDNAADPPDAGADTQSLKLALTVISIAVLTFLSQTFTGRLLVQKTFVWPTFRVQFQNVQCSLLIPHDVECLNVNEQNVHQLKFGHLKMHLAK